MVKAQLNGSKPLTIDERGLPKQFIADLKGAISALSKLPSFISLIKEATKNGPITVEFAASEEVPNGALWDSRIRTIRINQNCGFVERHAIPFLYINHLIFELHNAANLEFDKVLPIDFKTENDYALAKERAEYDFTAVPFKRFIVDLLSNPTVLQEFAQVNMPSKSRLIDFYNNCWGHLNGFDKYLDAMSSKLPGKDFSHMDLYRQHYQKVQKPSAKTSEQTISMKKDNALIPQFKNDRENNSNPPENTTLQMNSKPLITSEKKNIRVIKIKEQV